MYYAYVCLGSDGTAVCLVYNFVLLLPMLTNYFNFINIILIQFFPDQNEPRFFCSNYCGRSYKNKRSLWRHLKFECGVQPKFECLICNKKFTDNQSMKRHVILIHRHLIG